MLLMALYIKETEFSGVVHVTVRQRDRVFWCYQCHCTLKGRLCFFGGGFRSNLCHCTLKGRSFSVLSMSLYIKGPEFFGVIHVTVH